MHGRERTVRDLGAHVFDGDEGESTTVGAKSDGGCAGIGNTTLRDKRPGDDKLTRHGEYFFRVGSEGFGTWKLWRGERVEFAEETRTSPPDFISKVLSGTSQSD